MVNNSTGENLNFSEEGKIIRRIDNLGRVVLPMEYRAKLRLNKEDPVTIDCVGDEIIIKAYKINAD